MEKDPRWSIYQEPSQCTTKEESTIFQFVFGLLISTRKKINLISRYHPPMCYVTPTQNMMIKPRHKHVDSAGRCYLPYLTEWQAKTSTIYEMINYMSAVFGNDPPVYQKPTTQPITTTTTNTVQSKPTTEVKQDPKNNSNSSSSFFGVPSFFQPQEKTESLLTKKIIENVGKYKSEAVQEIDELIKVQNQLNERSGFLEDAFKQLEQDKKNCIEAINYFDKKEKEIEIWLQQHNDQIDVDQVVSVSDEQSQQFDLFFFNTFRILELVAMDHSIDDAVYYLDKALEKNVVELDQYLDV
jgi:ESCRT-I complex subunit TSG101